LGEMATDVIQTHFRKTFWELYDSKGHLATLCRFDHGHCEQRRSGYL